jgi:predicted transcriptional regulator
MERRCAHDIIFQILSHCLDSPRTFSNIIHTLELPPQGAEHHIQNLLALSWLAKKDNTYQTTFRGENTFAQMMMMNQDFAYPSQRKEELFLADYIFPERHEPIIKSNRRMLLEKSIRDSYEYERLYPIVEELAKKKGIPTDEDMSELFEEARRIQSTRARSPW